MSQLIYELRKNCCGRDGTGGREIEGSTIGPRGPKNAMAGCVHLAKEQVRGCVYCLNRNTNPILPVKRWFNELVLWFCDNLKSWLEKTGGFWACFLLGCWRFEWRSCCPHPCRTDLLVHCWICKLEFIFLLNIAQFLSYRKQLDSNLKASMQKNQEGPSLPDHNVVRVDKRPKTRVLQASCAGDDSACVEPGHF